MHSAPPSQRPPAVASARPAKRQRGFAVLITISLLAFLIMLMLTLTALLKVESTVSANSQLSTQAQQNALCALNIALSQLQKFAGPDQRATGTADLGNLGPATPKTPISASDGLGSGKQVFTFPSGGTKYWTGVWGSHEPPLDLYSMSPNTPAVIKPPSDAHARTYGAVLLNWLVSGNEGTTLTFSSITGEITAVSPPPSTVTNMAFTPDDKVNFGTNPMLTGPNGPTISGANGNTPAVLLVGPNSADPTIQAGAAPGSGNTSTYIVAPLVNIQTQNALVPGKDGVGVTTVGRYAWVVLDEGVKAKYNVRDRYGFPTAYTDAGTQPQARYRFQTAPRYGIENMTGMSLYTTPFTTPSTSQSLLSEVLTPTQIRFADSSLDNTVGLGVVRGHFHDLTTYSMGLMTDQLRGGLRSDLTWFLERSQGATGLAYISALPSKIKLSWYDPTLAAGNIITAAHNSILPDGTNNVLHLDHPDYALNYSPAPSKLLQNVSPAAGPTWDVLRSYYSMSAELFAKKSVAMRPATVTQMGITPNIVQHRISFEFWYDAAYKPYIAVEPVFVLGNPYAFPIKFPTQGIDLCYFIDKDQNIKAEWGLAIVKRRAQAGTGWEQEFTRTVDQKVNSYANTGVFSSGYYPILKDRSLSTDSAPSVLDQVIFHIAPPSANGGTMLPGQCIAFQPGPASSSAPTPQPAAAGSDPAFGPPHGKFYTNFSGAKFATGPCTVNLVACPSSGGVPYVDEVFFLHQCNGSSNMNSNIQTRPGGQLRWGDIVTLYPGVACTLEMRVGGNFAGSNIDTIIANKSQVLQSLVNIDLTGCSTVTPGALYAGPVVGGAYLSGGALASDSFIQSSGYRVSYATGPNGAVPQPHYIGGYYGFLALNDAFAVQIFDGNLSHASYPYNMTKSINYRTFADHNIRGANLVYPQAAKLNVPETFVGGKLSTNVGNGFPTVPPYARLFDRGGDENADEKNVSEDAAIFGGDLRNYPPKWGNSTMGNTTTTTQELQNQGQDSMYLYDIVPQDALNNPSDLPILSLAQLQHASLTADDDYVGYGNQPGYAVGNSWPSPYNARTVSVTHGALKQSGLGRGGQNNPTFNTYDISYLLNTALFDRYFFSAIPQRDAINNYAVSMNPRYKFASGYLFASGSYAPTYGDLNMYIQSPANVIPQDPAYNFSVASTAHSISPEFIAAETMMIDGAFNVNSTSPDAWFAFLSSLRSLQYSNSLLSGNQNGAPAKTDTNTAGTPFPRSLKQTAESLKTTDVTDNSAYTGYRRLTDDQLRIMATNIVDQVRMRGPFLSLAQFVNRYLISGDHDAGFDPQFLSGGGVLATVIDPPHQTDPNNKAYLQKDYASSGSTPINILNVGGAKPTTKQFQAATPTPGLGVTLSSAEGFPDASFLSTIREMGDRNTAIPGWLTQADMLQVLGPVMAARSDTFVIRAYGEVLDQNDSSNATANPVDPKILGRAWCEAVVQRFPDYVDVYTNPPWETVRTNGNANSGQKPMSGINLYFGRRFRVVSFRWLSPSDI